MNLSELDYRKYAEIYLNNKRMGIEFDALFEMAKKDLKSKEWLLGILHNPEFKGPFPFKVEEFINDYTMHLLLIFYMLNSSNDMFSYVNAHFIKEYVKNESEIEGVNDLSIHGKEEMNGLEEMYKFIHSKENDSTTGSIILTDLHEKLYSFIEGGKYARSYRNNIAYLPDSGVELEYPELIPRSMRQADREFDKLYDFANKMFNSQIEDRIHMTESFLEDLMRYKAELIRIHPFPDGNGRTIRGITNFLLEKAGLPPVYVKSSERGKYHEAMNKAIVDNDYRYLIGFYENKLCDSIKELVIDPFDEAINIYKEKEISKNKNKLDGNNVRRLLLQNDTLIKSKDNDEK